MDVNFKIGGKAGEGIAVTSFMFSKYCQRLGLNVFEYSEYPSLIRGGHTTGQVRASTESITCQKYAVDIMVILNEDCVKLHLSEFTKDTKFLIDTDDDKIDWSLYPSIAKEQIISVPLVTLSREATGKSLASNVVSLAVTAFLLGLDTETLKTVVKDFFEKKGQEVVDGNLKALEAGFQYARTQLSQYAPGQQLPLPSTRAQSLLVNGTEAIGLGALSAGVSYYSAYPMTPTSALMTFMADAQEEYPIVLKHAEDEIAAINNALGASFAGARAMTATAGGGFALMVEAVSLAAVTELPLVCMVGGRPGPATGLPTWTAQTDLLYVLNAGHGEFPRIVFTPGTIEECFKLTRLAFLLTEKYHTQAYIIADKYLLESRMTTHMLPANFTNSRYSFASDPLPEDNSYRRFELTDTGFSPRSVPGQAHGLQLTNSYEHDAFGYATEDAVFAKNMIDKRLSKNRGILQEVPGPVLLGPSEADVTLVCWGSTRLVVESALTQINAKKPNTINAIHILTMMPFKIEEFVSLASKAKRLLSVEGNATNQVAKIIRMETGINITEHITRYDGRPLYAEDMITTLKERGIHER